MRHLHQDLREFVALLNKHEARYLVIGGWAVAYHGVPRATGDIDFLVEATPENAARLLRVLDEFGFGGLQITSEDFLRPGRIVQLGFPPNRIDLITAAEGLDFDEAWRERVVDDLAGVRANVIGLAHLKASKRAAGRPRDIDDLRRLP
jgi:hypothetical protein